MSIMHPFRTMSVCFGIALMISRPIGAQLLKPGTWTGSSAKENGEVSQLTFDVAIVGDTTSITINVPERQNSFSVLAVRAVNDSLTFTLPFGDVKCALTRRSDGSYFGTCDIGEGQSSTIEMIPPANPPL